MSMALAIFADLTLAQRAVSALMRDGVSKDAISVLVRAREPEPDADLSFGGPLATATRAASERRVLGGGPLAGSSDQWRQGRPAHVVAYTLAVAGMTPAGARFFAQAICEGAVLVAVHGAPEDLDPARMVLDTYGRIADNLGQARAAWQATPIY